MLATSRASFPSAKTTSGSPLRFSRPMSSFANRERLAIASSLSFLSNSLRLRSNFFRDDNRSFLSLRVHCLNCHEGRVLNVLASASRAVLQVTIEKALHIISQFNGAVVALSAGVDSSLVAALAHKALGNRVVAVTAVSESLAPGEIEIAKKTARRIGIRHIIVTTDEVHNVSYKANPLNRCYYCKDTLYRELRRQADNSRLETILDGTQLDDFGDIRPGFLAAKEAGVRSPLAEAGFSKKDVRETARLIVLEVWDKTAMPCLSSSIAHDNMISVEKLSQVGQAESTVKRLSGARDIRVRHHGEGAAIEVSQEELLLFHRNRLMNRVKKELRLIGFTSVTIGPRKYPTRQDAAATGRDYLLPIVNTSNQ